MKYQLQGNVFEISQYDKAPPFASFLPGLCGANGIPLWTFYVNRGQGIATFGIHDRDQAIMEFSPAPIAYEDVERKGFRTFVKLDNGSYYEPFCGQEGNPQRNMEISPNGLSIWENRNGLVFKVDYFMLPHENIGALVRHVTVTNNSAKPLTLDLIDGMPRLLPHGIKNSEFKEMANLLKSYGEVKYPYKNLAFFKCRSSVEDSAKVKLSTAGHFMIAAQNDEVLPTICDGNVVFGTDTSLQTPIVFKEKGLKGVLDKTQYTSNKIPSAMTATKIALDSGESKSYHLIFGHADNPEMLEPKLKDFSSSAYIKKKQAVALALAESYTKDFYVTTNQPKLDAYLQQATLDNFLRGGYPYQLKSSREKQSVYLFSRRHGDLERDYNFFRTSAQYYSQGDGNFRDVCQNRRSNVLIHPEIYLEDVTQFVELIQIDGYNPLELRAELYLLQKGQEEMLTKIIGQHNIDLSSALPLQRFMEKPFRIGDLAAFLNSNCECSFSSSQDEALLADLIAICTRENQAVHKEGFWCDHWTYILDLIKNFESIYPDKIQEVLFLNKNFRYYQSPVRILPREQRYTLENGTIRQYDFTETQSRRDKQEPSGWLKNKDNSPVKVNLFTKLYLLAVLKSATLDANQLGIEMEGGKPGWNDALNGLPGLLGSSTSEMIDLIQLCSYLTSKLNDLQKLTLPKPIYKFGVSIYQLVTGLNTGLISSFDFWDKSNTLKEDWRKNSELQSYDKEISISAQEIKLQLEAVIVMVENSLKKAEKFADNGLIPTYFVTEAKAEYSNRFEYKEFTPRALPIFLETPAKLFNIKSFEQALALHKSIRKSPLYDEKLRMYKTCASLEGESMEIGRIRAFTPGWFERESVFLHMEYKLLLNLLKAGMHDTFFKEFRELLIPYQSPERYGRSTLENVSFIVSSQEEDETLHGRGFVARLSGSTAEVISMWLHIFIGDTFFYMEKGQLVVEFTPIIPSWMFDENHSLTVNYLGCKIEYINKSGKNTYGDNKAFPYKIKVEGEQLKTTRLEGKLAQAFRNKEIENIQLYFK